MNWFVDQANATGGTAKDSIYISTHIDSSKHKTVAAMPPHMYVYNRGSQKNSNILAKEMLKTGYQFYKKHFQK